MRKLIVALLVTAVGLVLSVAPALAGGIGPTP
ncbi:MAG: hypothetical protein QOJ10_1169 [Chloroflexota bacterium]|jgi:hypothetical protein|nr:hypothetical protein [Chloroflexota bacterium]